MTTEADRAAAARGLVPVLVGVTLVISIVSSLGAPLLPEVAQSLDVSLDAAQWSLTAALLAGTIAAPVLGRLGDGPHRREAILGALAVVFVGSIIAGFADSIGVLVAGRAMQGVGLGVAPVTMAVARDLLPADRVAGVIGLLSVSAAAGVGVGYPLSGLIAGWLGVHYAFLSGAVISGLAIAATLAVVPRSTGAVGAPLDVRGAVVVAAGLVALLLGVGQGSTWGWTSARVLGLFAVAAVILAGWVRLQLATTHPLVDLRLMRHRPVFGADLAAILLGLALYAFLTVVTTFVQMPSEDGFGFDGSALTAGLCLVPFSLSSLAASQAMVPLMRRYGARAILLAGVLMITLAGGFFALVHDALWQAFATMGIIGLGFGFTYGAIPGVIARAVPHWETGSALGLYQVIRSIGFSVGSALTASILAAHLDAATGQPAEDGFVLALWLGVGVCVLAAGACATLPGEREAPVHHDGVM